MKKPYFRNKTRLLLLALMMALGGQQIWAEVIRGQYQSCNYVIDTETGKMTVSGSGKVLDGFSQTGGEGVPYRSIVKEVVVEEGITGIDSRAFDNYSELERVKLPTTLSMIGQSAFASCKKLTSVNIPHGMRIIDGAAFHSCSALSTINLPEGLTEIGSAAFYGNKELKEVFIPSTIIHLRANAFMNSGVSRIVAYPSFLSAGTYDFYSTLPAEGGKICIINGTGSIPATVTSNLPSAWTVENATVLTGIAGTSATYTLYPDAGLLIISGTGNMNASFTSTGDIVNNKTKVKKVVVEEGMAGIGYSSFADMINLTEVSLPSTLKSIYRECFMNDSLLTSIVIPDGVTLIEHRVFRDCKSLTDVSIPGSVKSFGDRVFFGCSSLESITIPEGVETIGNGIFEECLSLKHVSLPSTLTSFNGNAAFKNCSILESIELPATNYPSTRQMFNGCSALKSITLPEGMTQLDYGTFAYCFSLKDITFPSTLTTLDMEVFLSCKGLEEITIPSSVTSMNMDAFRYCSNLKKATILAPLPELPSRTFYDCSLLEEVSLPGSIERIGQHVFYNCKALKSVEIPSKVTVIAMMAFSGCSSLTSINIPSGVTSMEYSAFEGCTSLSTILFCGEVAPTLQGNTQQGNNVFRNLPKSGTLYIPYGTSSEYASLHSDNLPTWSISNLGKIGLDAYWTYDETDHIVKIFGTGAIDRNKYINLADKNAFEALNGTCYKLEIGEGITAIPNSIFYGWSQMMEVSLPSTLISIGNTAFSGCYSLQSITLPEGLTSIGQVAFGSCQHFASIDIPASVTSIGNGAFRSCPNMTEIIFRGTTQPTTLGTNIFPNLPTNGVLLYPNGDATSFEGVVSQVPSSWINANGKCGTSAYYRISKPSTTSYQLSILGQGKVDSNPWLSDGSKITSISIGEGITGIGQAMLGGMPKITSITFPSTLTSLDANVLDRSYGVKELVFQTVTPPTIPLNTYLNTTSWTGEVVCPLNGFDNYKNSQLVKYLRGNWSVSTGGQWGGNLAWKFNSGTEALTLTGVGEDMPDLQDGKQPWHTLNSQIRKAVIDNFTSVGKYAFAHSSIKEIQWPSNPMKLIDYRSFYYCNSLRELTLPAQVDLVATDAFETCAQIYSLTVPAGVKALGQEFMPCSRLTHIKFEGQQMPQLNADCGIQNNSHKTFAHPHIKGAVSFPAGADANYESLWSELPEMWRKTDGQLTDHMAYTLRHGVLSLYGHGTTSQLPTNLGGTERSSIDVLNLCQGLQMDNEATFFQGMKAQGCVIYDDGTCFTDQTKLPSGWTVLPSKTEVATADMGTDAVGSYTSTWQFDHGMLIFGGDGDVSVLSSETPGWQSYAGAIEKAKLDTLSNIRRLSGALFRGCKALTELRLTNDGRTLKAFQTSDMSDTKIEKLTLPAGITHIASNALHNMTSLKRLNIGCLNYKVVSTSGPSYYILYGCSALEEINLEGDYYKETFYDFLSTDGANKLVMGLSQPAKLLINGKEIHTVKITASETKNRMFNNLSNIKNVVFDHEGTNIVSDIFMGSSVKHVTAYTLNPDNIPASSGLYTTGITLHVPVGAKQAYSNSAGWNRFSKVIDNAYSLAPTLAEENEQTFNTTTSSRTFVPEIVDSDDEYVLTLSPTNMATIEWSDIIQREYMAWNGKAWNGTGDLSVTLNVALKNSPNLMTSVRFNIETDRIILDPTSDYTRTEDMEIEHLGMDLPPIEYGNFNSWMPIYLPIDVDVQDYPELKFAEIYAISPLEDTNGDGKVTLEDDPMMILCPLNVVGDMLYANTPYLYHGQASTQSIYLNAANHTLYGAIHEPYDLATAHNTYLLNGLYTNTTVKADDDNFVVDPEHGELTYCEHPAAMKSFSWYMHVTGKNYAGTEALEAMKAKPMKIVTMGEDIDQETAIRIVKEQQGALMQSQYIYSLDGKRIPAGANLPAGIYIKQGKRIVVK